MLMHRLGLAAIALCATGATLQSQSEVAGPPAPTQARRPFDAVVAVIGDRVILRSTLDRELEARSAGTKLDRETELELSRRIVRDMVRAEIWVQHGKSIGEKAPLEFEKSINKMIDQQLRREIRESGSITRLDEELGLIGSSWADRRRRERAKILEQFGRGEAITKLRRHQGLLVTPREMRNFYDENPGLFHSDGSVDVAWVHFDIEGGDVEAARGRVLEARQAWAAEDLTSADVAQRFGGTDFGTKTNIRSDASDDRAKFLKEFAAGAELGQVSQPILRTRSGAFALLRAVSVEPARSQPFADPDVQALIRHRIATQQIAIWHEQVMRRKQRRVYLWPPNLNLDR